MEYKIILESFEGPMDLLIHLIDEAEIDIYDIPINEITEQYIGYITTMKELDLEVTSEFLLMASTLLEIKSRMLLPQRVNKDDEQLQLDEIDPRLELVRRLIEYKKYKQVSKELGGFEDVQKKVYYKPKEDLSFFTEENIELEEMDLNELVKALNNLLIKNKKSQTTIDINEIQKDEYTLDESIKKIRERFKDEEIIEFNDLFNENANRKEIIVTFLSLLELIKMEDVTIYQKDSFSEILISKKGRKDVN